MSFETANNIFDEIIPYNLTMGDDPDWQQGEIVAENSIRLTSGFHASASDQVHIHIGHIDRSMLIKEGWSKNDKNYEPPKKNTTNNIDIIETENITIFPNPTTGIFTIKTLQGFENLVRFEITDITGKIVLSKNNINNNTVEIDISKKNSGIYILKIQIENKITTHKIVKQ